MRAVAGKKSGRDFLKSVLETGIYGVSTTPAIVAVSELALDESADVTFLESLEMAGELAAEAALSFFL